MSAEAVPDVDRRRLSRTERLIAGRMVQSRTTIPAFTVRRDVDMAPALAWRHEQQQGAAGPVPSVNDLVVRACALALREQPRVNAAVDGDELVSPARVNVGVAVDADGLLLVPVLRDADRGTLAELAAASRELVSRARARELTPADMEGATFTVSNLGMLGVHEFDAIVSPGQAAILAVGAIRREPVLAADGTVGAGVRMALRLSSDHRIVYGAQAAGFAARVAGLLEEPGALA
jgi:pyruvate dehydrogenase E2 component (dihydrolipoamide acetyltransferase)